VRPNLSWKSSFNNWNKLAKIESNNTLKKNHNIIKHLIKFPQRVNQSGAETILLLVQFRLNPTKKNYEEMIFMSNRSNSSNNLLVPGVEQALNQMKVEIASEFGVQLGADTTSRANGSVGGEITKRLVSMAQQQLSGTGQF
jgi:hypothetical protein